MLFGLEYLKFDVKNDSLVLKEFLDYIAEQLFIGLITEFKVACPTSHVCLVTFC